MTAPVYHPSHNVIKRDTFLHVYAIILGHVQPTVECCNAGMKPCNLIFLNKKIGIKPQRVTNWGFGMLLTLSPALYITLPGSDSCRRFRLPGGT